MPTVRLPVRNRVARRRTGWATGVTGDQTLTVATVALFGTGTQALQDGLTIVRTRGEFLAFVSSVDAVTSGMRVGVGICVVTENAFGAGVGSVPTPIADLQWDGWLWHSMGHVFGVAAEGAGFWRQEIDSKAMRKMKEDDIIVAVLEVSQEVGTVTLQTKIKSRTLFKLA